MIKIMFFKKGKNWHIYFMHSDTINNKFQHFCYLSMDYVISVFSL